MSDAALAKIFGTKNEREIKAMQPAIAAINDLEPAMQQPRCSSESSLRTTTYRRPLIVVVRQGLKILLEREGILVAGEASNGRRPSPLAKQFHPDVAVLDFSMPLLNGLEAARAVCDPPGYHSGLGSWKNQSSPPTCSRFASSVL